MRAPESPATGSWSERGATYADSAPHRLGPSLPKLYALARPVASDHCLDIGTGTGHTAALLARSGATVVGLDPAEGMLAAARERYRALPNLEFLLARGDATGLADDTFDLVTARHTLHHHADLPATLAEVRRVLRPGGRFVLVDEVTPDAASDAWLDAVERARDATHVRAYSLTEWRAMLRAAGLDVIVADIETEYELDVRSWVARTCEGERAASAVARLFREAGSHERARFSIVYEAGEAVRFKLPMAIVLACKPLVPNDVTEPADPTNDPTNDATNDATNERTTNATAAPGTNAATANAGANGVANAAANAAANAGANGAAEAAAKAVAAAHHLALEGSAPGPMGGPT